MIADIKYFQIKHKNVYLRVFISKSIKTRWDYEKNFFQNTLNEKNLFQPALSLLGVTGTYVLDALNEINNFCPEPV